MLRKPRHPIAVIHAPPIAPGEVAPELAPRERRRRPEHLVPGRGDTGAAAFLNHLARSGFSGEVVLEINTRRCTTREEREADLRESLEFAIEHLSVGVPGEPVGPGAEAEA